MPHNRALTLKVANRKDFIVPLGILFVLTVISALLSPQPFLLTIMVFLLFGAGGFIYILDFHKVNDVKLILIIFPDGQARLESDQAPEIVGYFSGQQWCTHGVAILRVTIRSRQQHLAVLSAQQKADEFRRLKVWLRQDFCSGTGDKQVSDI